MESFLSISAVILSIISIVISISTFIWTVRRDRKQATLDAYNILQSEVFDQLNLYRPSDIREIAAKPTSEEYKKVSGLIARIEHFCVGVNTKIYDRDTVYLLAHGYLDSEVIMSRIKPILEMKHRKAEENYYENIDEVLLWMKKRSEQTKSRQGVTI